MTLQVSHQQRLSGNNKQSLSGPFRISKAIFK